MRAERLGEGTSHWEYSGEGGVTGQVVAEEKRGKGWIVFCVSGRTTSLDVSWGVHPYVRKPDKLAQEM